MDRNSAPDNFKPEINFKLKTIITYHGNIISGMCQKAIDLKINASR